MHQAISTGLDIQQFRHKFRNLWACEAIDLMCRVFRVSFMTVYHRGIVFNLDTFKDEWEVYEGHLASEIRVSFYGGPDDGLRIDGTLLTMFLDQLFYAQYTGKKSQVQKALGYRNCRV